jgi:outer membrane lipoprotein-sorting protein
MKKLILVIVLLATVGLGCKFFQNLAPGGGGGASSDPKADVIEASRKFIALKSFSAKMEGTGQTELRSQVDYAAPDRFHVKYLAGTGAGTEMIMIGDQTYMKSGNSWSKFPGGGSMPTLRDSFTEEGLKTLSDVKFEGSDTVDGKSALVYTYKNVTPQGSYPFNSKIWIDKDSRLPIKIVVDYPSGPLKQMTVNYDTETPVTIEPPIK